MANQRKEHNSMGYNAVAHNMGISAFV